MDEHDLGLFPMFAGVGADTLRRLSRQSQAMVVDAGCAVARQGEAVAALLLLEAGTLEANVHTVDGRVLQLGTFTARCAVDKVALLDGGAHTATWKAIGPARIRRIPRQDVVGLIHDVDSVRRHVMQHLAAQARRNLEGLVAASTQTAATRTITWLAEHMSTSGPLVRLPTGGQEGLARAVGASRVTVNRCLQQLAREAIIQVEPGGAVRVLRPEILAARAGATSRTRA